LKREGIAEPKPASGGDLPQEGTSSERRRPESAFLDRKKPSGCRGHGKPGGELYRKDYHPEPRGKIEREIRESVPIKAEEETDF